MTGPGIQLPPTDPRIRVLNLIRPPAFVLLCAGSLSILFNVLQVILFAFKIPSPFAPAEALMNAPESSRVMRKLERSVV